MEEGERGRGGGKKEREGERETGVDAFILAYLREEMTLWLS